MKPVSKRKKRSFTVQNSIPYGVYRISQVWTVFLQHMRYYEGFDKKAFWTGIISGLVQAPLDAAKIFFTGLLVDSIVNYYTAPTGLPIFGILIPNPVFYIIGIVLVGRLSMVLDTIGAKAKIVLKNASLEGYRKTVAEKFHTLNAQEIDEENVKDLITKINAYWAQNATSLYENVTRIGGYILSIVIAFYALFTLSPVIAIFVLLVPEIQIFVMHVHFRKHADFVDNIAPLMLERNYLYDTLTNARTFAERKVNGVYKPLISRFNYVASIVSKGYTYVLGSAEDAKMSANIIDHIALGILKVVILGTSLVKRTAVGHITYLLGYTDSLYSNSFDLQNKLITMYDELTFVEFLNTFLATEGFADSTKKGKRLKKGIPPRIDLESVSFHYSGTKKLILKDASITIKPGERVLIFGRDGSGKSSLLALLAGMYAIQSGAIKYNRIPIQKLARGEVKRKMSVVPEDFARYYMTLKENILLGDPAKQFDEKLYKKALSITGLDEWMDREKIDDAKTILGNYFEGSVSISSGHWQRIAIARAIYRNREIFLLDQPFTYIDHEAVKEIMPKLMKFIGKRTVIFISENLWHAEHFNTHYRLENLQLKEVRNSKSK